jgi:hypothetical protein
MNLISRVKRPLALVALVLTLVLSGAFLPTNRVASTATCPRFSTLVHYYSDANHTTEVGERYFKCDGTATYIYGVGSPYYDSEVVDVCCGCQIC